jgi:hydroxymethylpyrimidine pyrophosphatase-like HAD family hydrolase
MQEERYKKVFKVEKSAADLSFEAFWNIWGLKLKREHSEKAWNKLKESEKIKCFLNVGSYFNHLLKTGENKAHLVTWLNQKRYNDEY